MQDPTKEPKEQVFFQESNIYWAPSSNPTELYAQLAKYKFREILSHQLKYVNRVHILFWYVHRVVYANSSIYRGTCSYHAIYSEQEQLIQAHDWKTAI